MQSCQLQKHLQENIPTLLTLRSILWNKWTEHLS